jgi:hypothetical protein
MTSFADAAADAAADAVAVMTSLFRRIFSKSFAEWLTRAFPIWLRLIRIEPAAHRSRSTF